MAYPYLIVQEIFIDPSPKWRDMSEHCWQIVTASPPGCDSYDHFFLPTRGITDQRTSRVSLIIESFFFFNSFESTFILLHDMFQVVPRRCDGQL